MRVLVTGGSGLVGKHLAEHEPTWNYLSSFDGDLRDRNTVWDIFEFYQPDAVIHLAAKVGGIQSNSSQPMDYFTDNVLINTNVVQTALDFGVRKFVGLISSCAYTDVSPSYPLQENQLFEGEPHMLNYGYGMAKRMLAAQIKIARQHLGKNFSYLIPSNLYGLYETGDISVKHFVGALMDKIIRAEEGDGIVTLFGDGTPLRQFTYAEDVANILRRVIEQDVSENLNVSIDENLTIDQIARIAVSVSDNPNLTIQYDSSKPNGQYRKDIDTTLLKKVFGDFKFTPYIEGLRKTYRFYKNKSRDEN